MISGQSENEIKRRERRRRKETKKENIKKASQLL
jgi:hypothetical protein